MASSWDESFDVVVVGSGFAGLAAAIEALSRDRSCSVAIVEKMPTVGGNSLLSAGQYAAWRSKLNLHEKLGLPKDDPETFAQDILAGGEYLGQPHLVRKLAYESAECLDWLIDMGVEWQELLVKAGGHSRHRTHQTIRTSGRDIVEPMVARVRELGASLLLRHKVVNIVREGVLSGRVVGVEVEVEGGTLRRLKARRGVVLASGGFSNDVEFRRMHVPYLGEEFKSTNHAGATAEVLRSAMKIGAAAVHLDHIQLYPFAEPNTGALDGPAVIPFTLAAFSIYVDKRGRRFINELARRKDVALAQILKVREKPTFTIFDDQNWPFFIARDIIERGLASGRIIKADSIEDLAAKAGIDPRGLRDTVDRYNEYLKMGRDLEFNKSFDPRAKPIEKPPFYAIAQWPAVHYTMGGLLINAEAQVLDVDGRPIPGLFAAGEVTGGIHGADRLGSVSIPECIVFGRTAGRNVVRAH